MSRLLSHMRTLRWRLTVSYAAVTLVALLTLEGAFVVVPGILALSAPQRPLALAQDLAQMAPQAAPHLRQTPADRAGLGAWLSGQTAPLYITEGLTDNIHRNISIVPGQNATLLVVDSAQHLVGSLAPKVGRASDPAGLQRLPEAREVVAAALANQHDTAKLVQSAHDGRTIAGAPITDTQGHVLGALVLGVDLRGQVSAAFTSDLLGLLPSLILFTLIAVVLGTLFGLLTARGLTRRLRILAHAADAWSRGDFIMAARDSSGDELGQLSRDLNRMAEQVQALLQSRQQLAVVEERNRLARDLHDSVKQQVFATAMQVAAARALVRRDPEAAEARLGEVERLVGEAQRELTALIAELRPAALANKGLGPALRDYCGDWSRRSGIAVEVGVQGEQPAPLEVEQALFRVAQEALANIARHSGATSVEVRLSWERGMVALALTDNGDGFDVAAATGKGVGLQSMRERVEAIGGTLSIRRAPGGPGTRVEARVPVPQAAIAAPEGVLSVRDAAQA